MGFFLNRWPRTCLRWRHSGFSTDASIMLPGGKVLFHTSYSEYFKENSKLLSVADFIALLKPTHPPQGSTGPQALRALLLMRPRHVEP